MAEYKEGIQKLLQSEMSRRDFIKFMGAASLGVIGVTSIVRGLHGLTEQQVQSGYGSGAYGGSDSPVASSRRS